MKIFTNRSITKKVVIVILTVVMLTFTVPKPVNAVSNILLSPIITLATSLLDAGQHLLEWAMLGETSNFMKDIDETDTYKPAAETGYHKKLYSGEIDGSLWGWDDVNIPVIQYTPEEIFSNRVPMLDVNFIKPSVTTGNDKIDNERNIAKILQPTIASWYVAIRTLAIVGLLSVLVYLGIRMLLTSVAADRAKYKKMMMDWLIAMCLLFLLHYIMSFALTMSEVVTSMIANTDVGSISVEFDGGSFSGNLMSYVRFMIQSTDTMTGLAFFFLYLMLLIYSFRFTWTYLKRVVNMAFLTLIAPVVALTYPIDKVSDGKAQAFDLWIKEFAFNALLQPLHLLLYIVLLGSATELAAINPLYAVICLGFILAAEKLLKKMFGFDKASGGTLGSLAGAAGVSALAHRALMGVGKGPHAGKGAEGKVRTNNQYQRQGRKPGANKGYNSFDKADNQGISELADLGNEQGNYLPEGQVGPDDQYGMQYGSNDAFLPPLTDEDQEFHDNMQQRSVDYENAEPSLEDQMRYAELDDKIRQREQYNQEQEEVEPIGNPRVQEALEALGPEVPMLGQVKTEEVNKRRPITAKTIKGIGNGMLGVAKELPKKAIRGTAKTAARVALGGALGITAGVIGATMGDGEKAISMAAAGFGVGATTGGRAFESTIGQAIRDRTIIDSYGAGKYGSAIDARNEKADKAYLRSQQHYEEYEKYFKNGQFKMSKKDFDKATKEYREVGITDTKTIRRALHLEQQYAKKDDGQSKESIRGKVQNIIQTYDEIDKKAVYGSNRQATEATLRNLSGQLSSGNNKQKRAIANEILQGYRDWYNVS